MADEEGVKSGNAFVEVTARLNDSVAGINARLSSELRDAEVTVRVALDTRSIDEAMSKVKISTERNKPELTLKTKLDESSLNSSIAQIKAETTKAQTVAIKALLDTDSLAKSMGKVKAETVKDSINHIRVELDKVSLAAAEGRISEAVAKKRTIELTTQLNNLKLDLDLEAIKARAKAARPRVEIETNVDKDRVQRGIVAGIGAAISGAVGGLTSAMSGAATALSEAFSTTLRSGVGAGIASLGSSISTAFSTTGPLGVAVLAGAAGLALMLGGALVVAVGTFVTALVGALAIAVTAGLALAGGLILAGGFFGIVAAALAGGILLVKDDPRVQGAFKRFKQDTWDKLWNSEGAEAFIGPLVASMDRIGAAFDRWMPHINNIMKGFAPLLTPVTTGLIGMIDKILPGLEHFAQSNFVKDLMNVFGSGLIAFGDSVSKFIDKFLNNGPAMQGTLQAMQSGFSLIGWAINGAGDGFNKLATAWNTLSQNKQVMDLLRSMGDSLGKIGDKFLDVVTKITQNKEAMQGIQTAFNGFVNIIMWVIGAIGTLVTWAGIAIAKFDEWKKKSELFRDAIKVVEAVIAGVIGAVLLFIAVLLVIGAIFVVIVAAVIWFISHLKGWFEDGLRFVRDQWNAIWGEITQNFAGWYHNVLALVIGWWQNVQNWFHDSLEWIKSIWNTSWGWVKDTAANIWNSILSTLAGWWQNIQNWFHDSLEWVKSIWNISWQWVKDTAANVWNAILNTLAGWWQNIQNWFHTALEWVKSTWNTAWQWVKDTAANIWNSILSTLAGWWQNIQNAFHAALEWVKNEWNTAWTWVKDKVTELWDVIKQAIQAAVDFVRNTILQPFMDFVTKTIPAAFQTAVDGVKTAWDKIQEYTAAPIRFVVNVVYTGGIKKVWDAIADVVHLPKLPDVNLGFASGGFVQGPGTSTSDSIHAKLSDGEYVVNAAATSRNRPLLEMINSGGLPAEQPGAQFAGGGLFGAISNLLGGGRRKAVWIGANGDNEDLMNEHQDHVHVAMDVPPMGFPQIIALGNTFPGHSNPVSTFRPGSHGSGGGLDHHSEGRAVDWGGANQDAFAMWWSKQAGVIELIHRTASADYGIFGGGGGGGGGGLGFDIPNPASVALHGIIDPLVSWVKRMIESGLGGHTEGWYPHAKAGANTWIDTMVSKADELVPKTIHVGFGGGGGGGGGGGNVQQWAGIASEELAKAGAPGTWLGPLLARMQQESGGDPNAINRTDSNAQAGHPSQGLLQTIPSTFATYRDPSNPGGILDPRANIAAAIRYIKARYGDIANLPAGGYAGGGAVMGAGSSMSDNINARLSNGEFVVNAAETAKHLPLLEAINKGQTPGFATGGLVQGFANGGVANAGDKQSGADLKLDMQVEGAKTWKGLWDNLHTLATKQWTKTTKEVSDTWDKSLVETVNTTKTDWTGNLEEVDKLTKTYITDTSKFTSFTWLTAMDQIKTGTVQQWTSSWDQAKNLALSGMNSVISTMNDGIKAVNVVLTAVGLQFQIPSVAPVVAKAEGGYIQGPGGPTSDSINARLSNGEFVLRASAVDRIGVPTLNQLNATGDISFIRGDPSGMAIRTNRPVPFDFGFAMGGDVAARILSTQQWLYQQAGKPYVMGAAGPGAYDCSGLVSAVLKHLEGQNPYGRLFSTVDEGNFFLPGFGGRDDLNVGWYGGGGADGHTVGSLGGLNFEATPPNVLVGRTNMVPGDGAFIHKGHHVVGGGIPFTGSGDGASFHLFNAAEAMAQIRPAIDLAQSKFAQTAMGQVMVGAWDKIEQGLETKAKLQEAAQFAGGPLTAAQGSIMQQALAEAKLLGASAKVILALFEAGFVESGWTNSANATDHDSVGFLQQRPSAGWGSVDQIMNVPFATRSFVTRAMGQQGAGSAGQLAQAVQVSAFPGRYDSARGAAMGALQGLGYFGPFDGFAQGGLVSGLYDTGGYLPPGISAPINSTAGRERVLSPGADVALQKRIESAPDDRALYVSVYLDGECIADKVKAEIDNNNTAIVSSLNRGRSV